ncbi:MAG: hypothetical protein AAF492_26595, partial [Verrucomicrobiota bacterium]
MKTDAVSVRFSEDSSWVVAATKDGVGYLLETDPWKMKSTLRHRRGIQRPVISPNHRFIGAATPDNAAVIWEYRNQQIFAPYVSFDHSDVVSSVRFSPASDRLVSAGADDRAIIWSLSLQRALGQPMVHGNDVLWADFSPDGKVIVTGSRDTTARVWDAFSGQPLSQPLYHGSAVNFAQFDPESRRILTIAPGGLARVWTVRLGGDNQPIPPRFAAFAQAAGGLQLDNKNALVSVNPADRQRTFEAAAKTNGENPYEHFIKDFARQNRAAGDSIDGSIDRKTYVTALLGSNRFGNANDAVRLDPENPRALSKRAALTPTIERPSESQLRAGAVADLKTALALAPNDPQVHLNAAEVYRRIDRLDTALLEIDQALACNDRDPVDTDDYMQALTRTYIDVGNRELKTQNLRDAL